MPDRDTLRTQYRTGPEPFWTQPDTHDVVLAAQEHGWAELQSWGEDGWHVGDWPRSGMFTRTRNGRWEFAHYTARSVVTYAFPDQHTRDAVIDDDIFHHWKTTLTRHAIHPYQRTEHLPPQLRGPHGPERTGTPQLLKTLVIPTAGYAEVWYVHPDLDTLRAIVGGHLESITLTPDAHAYCDEEGKLRGRPVNRAATMFWHGATSATPGWDVICGTVIILGNHGAAETDCPQWPIDALAYLNLIASYERQ